MNGTFESQVKHYREKFHRTVDSIQMKTVEGMAKKYFGWDTTKLEAEFKANSPEFRKLCYTYASTLMPGRVSCTTYAGVVAAVAKGFNVPYTAMSGFCLQKNSPRYEMDKASFDAKKAEGVEHPFFATHTYVVINGVDYEYYNGDTSNIDHLDVVEIG